MHSALTDLLQWDALEKGEQLAIAEALEVPEGFVLARLEAHEQLPQHHRIARFQYKGVNFSLVPGGRATLGWDRTTLSLTPEQRSWLAKELQELWGEAPQLEKLLDEWMVPLHEVDIAPMLVEVLPQPAEPVIPEEAWDDDDFDDPVAGLSEALAKTSFRLLTSDEWEWCHRAGGTTFFRWGDAWPTGAPFGASGSFNGHRELNAFGLDYNESPYVVECIGGAVGFRAGDGGASVCGGTPQPYGWHTYASAYLYPRAVANETLFELFEEARFRRVVDIR